MTALSVKQWEDLTTVLGWLLDEDHAAGDDWLEERTGVSGEELEQAVAALAKDLARA